MAMTARGKSIYVRIKQRGENTHRFPIDRSSPILLDPSYHQDTPAVSYLCAFTCPPTTSDNKTPPNHAAHHSQAKYSTDCRHPTQPLISAPKTQRIDRHHTERPASP